MLNVGSIVASAELNIQGFVSNLKVMHREGEKSILKLERRLEAMGGSITRAGDSMTKMITGPIAGMGTALFMLQRRTGQYADTLLDLEENTGVSTDTLQEFRHVARIAGVDSDAFASSISGLSRRMSGIIDGSNGASRALRSMGISAHDANGNIRDTEDIMVDAIAGLGEVENAMERASMANEIFGRRWEELGPIIGMGSNEIQKARDEAHDLGMVLGRDALDNANEFRVELETMQAEVMANARAIAIDMMPAVRELMPLFRDGAQFVVNLARSFANLSAEQQRQRAILLAIVAGIGPFLSGVGRATTGIVAMSRAVRALTTAMLRNPWTAMAVGLALIAERAISASRRLRDVRREVDELNNVDFSGTVEEVERIDRAISGLVREIERAQFDQQMLGMLSGILGIDDRLEGLQNSLKGLIETRKELTDAMGMKLEIPELGTGALLKYTGAVDRNTESKEENVKAHRAWRDVLSENREKIYELIDGMEALDGQTLDRIAHLKLESREAERHIQLIEKLTDMYARMDAFEDMDIDRPQIEPEGIERSVDALGQMPDAMLESVDAGQNLSQTLGMIGESSYESGERTMAWTGYAVQAFDRLAFEGAKFLDVLKSIGRQLATRGFMTLITTLATGGTLTGGSLLGGMFGGVFHSGGVVKGSGEKVILARGGEGVFTPAQMQAMGNVGRPQAVSVKITGRLVGEGENIVGVIDRTTANQSRTQRI